MPFFTTRPTRRISPIADEMFRSVPVSHSSSSAPPSESGAATRMRIAGSHARNWTTRIMNTSTTPSANTIRSSRKA